MRRMPRGRWTRLLATRPSPTAPQPTASARHDTREEGAVLESTRRTRRMTRTSPWRRRRSRVRSGPDAYRSELEGEGPTQCGGHPLIVRQRVDE